MIRLFSILLVGLTAAAACIAQDVGLTFPEGFSATVFHEGVGRARHLAVRDNGDVYVAIRHYPARPNRNFDGNVGGIVALRDTDKDGVADVVERFGNINLGTGMGIFDNHLYFSSSLAVYRQQLVDGELLPQGMPKLVVGGFPAVRHDHGQKSFAIDPDGNLYVNSGVLSNNCQEERVRPGSPGRDPCPELERSAAIWKFDARGSWQDQVRNGERYVTGIRVVIALTWNPIIGKLFFVMHGRDALDILWPDHYSAADRAELPAEEFHAVQADANIGWPYTYYDQIRGQRMVSPEYGGDGDTPSDSPEYQDPLIGFPGHWSPNGILIYTGDAFPKKYYGGAFIAFHGSWNRAPAPQAGFKVVFVPLDDTGEVAGDWEVFADGFSGMETVRNPRDAKHRPIGLAQGPEGALYISDSVVGRIWKVTYEASP
ncbi:MAG: sorbosone dehydrogenase [Gammaproteobacteria bacterium]